MANTFNNAQEKLNSTNITTVYTAPNNTSSDRAVVLSILVANVDGANSADITITKADNSDNEQSLLAWTIPVPADTALEILANKLVLKAGEKIRATASAADDLHVTVSVLEIT